MSVPSWPRVLPYLARLRAGWEELGVSASAGGRADERAPALREAGRARRWEASGCHSASSIVVSAARVPLAPPPRSPPPPLPGRMRLRSARVGFGCVVAAERSCEARESEPGGEGWSLHGGEPEEPPPLPTPPPQPPPPPPPRRPPPGADGLVRSRRGGTRTSGRQHTAQHGPGNQAPLGGQLTGECAGREDHRAFQTIWPCGKCQNSPKEGF